MARFVKGDVVAVDYPYVDLSATKRRPALVIAVVANTDNLILCQITSQFARDSDAISLTPEDFAEGSLSKLSNVRPNRLITLDDSLVLKRVGSLTKERLRVITDTLVDILQR